MLAGCPLLIHLGAPQGTLSCAKVPQPPGPLLARWSVRCVKKRVSKQVAGLDRSRELEAVRWTESVSEFDANEAWRRGHNCGRR